RRHGPSGRGDPPAGRRASAGIARTGDRAARRDRAGDARRIHLRARADRRKRGAVGRRPPRRLRRNRMTAVPLSPPRRIVELTIDGDAVRVPEGSTILEACRQQGIDTPTLCYLENLTPVNVCRVCVVEVENSRVLVPACSRKVENGMAVKTDSERVQLSRRMVLEFLGSSVDLELTSPDVKRWVDEYGAEPDRYGPRSEPA